MSGVIGASAGGECHRRRQWSAVLSLSAEDAVGRCQGRLARRFVRGHSASSVNALW